MSDPATTTTPLLKDDAVQAPPAPALTAFQKVSLGSLPLSVPLPDAEQLKAHLTKFLSDGSDPLDPYHSYIERLLKWDSLRAGSYFVAGFLGAFFLAQKRFFTFAIVAFLFCFVAFFFIRNLAKLRQKISAELVRKAGTKTLAESSESAEWLNVWLEKFWTQFEPGLSKTIMDSVNGVLSSFKPAFLDDLSLSEFTLGSQPIHINFVKIHPAPSPDVMIMDMDVEFTPYDEESLPNSDQTQKKASRVALIARMGRNIASAPIPVLVKDISFSGTMRCELTFYPVFPHIKQIDASFYKPPKIDFNLKPLSALNVMDVPGFKTHIISMVHASIKDMLIAPNKYTVDMTAEAIESPLGVLKVTVFQARSLKNTELLKKSDPYANILLGSNVVAKTVPIENSVDPLWNETHFVPVYKSTFAQLAGGSDELKIEIRDDDTTVGKDGLMGIMEPLKLSKWLTLLSLPKSSDPLKKRPWEDLEISEAERSELEGTWGSPEETNPTWRPLVIKSGKALKQTNSQIQVEISFLPAAEKPSNAIEAARMLKDTHSGILQICFHGAKDLKTGTSLTTNPYLVLTHSDTHSRAHSTPVRKRTSNPVWENTFTSFIKDYRKIKYVATIYNSMDLLVDAKLGDLTIDLNDVISKESLNGTWMPLYNTTTGQVRITVKFIRIPIVGAAAAPKPSKPPLGSLAVKVQSAKGLKNVDGPLDKSDPYVVLDVQHRTFGRTRVIEDTLAPEWNESFEGGVFYQESDVLTLTLTDWNPDGSTKPLGSLDLPVSTMFGDSRTSDYVKRALNDGLLIEKINDSAVAITAPIYLVGKRDMSHEGTIKFEVSRRDVVKDKLVGYEQIAAAEATAAPPVDTVPTESSDASATLAEAPKASVDPIQSILDNNKSGVVHFRVVNSENVNATHTYFEIYRGKRRLFSSLTQADAEATWDQAVDFIVSDIDTDVVDILLKVQGKEFQDDDDVTIGQWSNPLRSIIGTRTKIDLGDGQLLNVGSKFAALTESSVAVEVDYGTPDARQRRRIVRGPTLGNLKKVGTGLGQGVSQIGQGVTSGIGQIGQGVTSGIGQIGHGVTSGIGQIGHGVTSGIGKLGKVLTRTGTSGNLLEGVESGGLSRSVAAPKQSGSTDALSSDSGLVSGTLYITYKNGIDLPSVDLNGKSDPFIRTFVDDKKIHTTATHKKNLNPEFNEACAPPPAVVFGQSKVRIEIWDESPMHMTDKLLGTVQLPWKKLEGQGGKIVELVEDLSGKHNCGRLRFEAKFVAKEN
ncbi:uncharacterized protein BJ171DRAFT_569132 [Polychytrium aggregatum]|uniref:uncharacterized protein n=1 Tax=Polychytrium aggregatum TaxID=110093 RepID=UPI0022FEC136|nr:uncharacterized protein BJ171DRAFT_569132 [Polychytrium aggregatum]KAI9203145.1 hypothetical protein BJ171DRAFT_569132 [Polychytrium aggregatum]